MAGRALHEFVCYPIWFLWKADRFQPLNFYIYNKNSGECKHSLMEQTLPAGDAGRFGPVLGIDLKEDIADVVGDRALLNR
jgi:hypothetical protein